MAKSIKEWPRERPRERLLSQGAGALSDAELLAVKADGVWRFQEDQFERWVERRSKRPIELVHAAMDSRRFSPMRKPAENSWSGVLKRKKV